MGSGAFAEPQSMKALPNQYQRDICCRRQRTFWQHAQLSVIPGMLQSFCLRCHAGVVDGYWEYRLKPWDMAAGVIIAQEAGAKITQMVRGCSTASRTCLRHPAAHEWCVARTAYATCAQCYLESGERSVQSDCGASAFSIDTDNWDALPLK